MSKNGDFCNFSFNSIYINIHDLLYRDASRVAVESSLALPPSPFPVPEIKSRPPPKSSGKQKLQNHETQFKSSKSKSKKPVVDSNETLSLLRHLNLLQAPLTPPVNNMSSRLDSEASISGVDIDDFLFTSLLETGTESLDIVDHIYDPGFTLGLEDCSLSMEFTDIG